MNKITFDAHIQASLSSLAHNRLVINKSEVDGRLWPIAMYINWPKGKEQVAFCPAESITLAWSETLFALEDLDLLAKYMEGCHREILGGINGQLPDGLQLLELDLKCSRVTDYVGTYLSSIPSCPIRIPQTLTWVALITKK
jgi:hypothetical protein